MCSSLWLSVGLGLLSIEPGCQTLRSRAWEDHTSPNLKWCSKAALNDSWISCQPSQSLQIPLSALQRKLNNLAEMHCCYQEVLNHLRRLYLKEEMFSGGRTMNKLESKNIPPIFKTIIYRKGIERISVWRMGQRHSEGKRRRWWIKRTSPGQTTPNSH